MSVAASHQPFDIGHQGASIETPRDRPPSSGTPHLPRSYVPRPRLWQELDRTTVVPVTVVVAPAGAGKTLGVAGWLRRSRSSTAGVSWLDAGAQWTADEMARVLAASAHEADGGAELLVIDDAHQLPAASLRLLDDRLNNAPASLRLMLLSRWDLPLTRLVPELLGHYVTVRGDVLRLDERETTELVSMHVGAASPTVIEAVSTYAQGWCAPAVLTARLIASASDRDAAARRYALTDARIPDRVVSEVFAALHPHERHLLLCVAGEETVTPSTASHLCQDPRAGETLAQLEVNGLLVTRVDDVSDAVSDAEREPRFRIHPMMGEVVRRRLASGGVDVLRARATVARAVELDVARGERVRAFARLVAVNEVGKAAELLAVQGITMVTSGEGPALAAFVDRNPAVIVGNARTCFVVALERWQSDESAPARTWLERVRTLGRDSSTAPEDRPAPTVMACVRLMCARLGLEALQPAMTNAQRTADRAGEDDDALPPLLLELGVVQNWTGELALAERNLTAAAELCRRRGSAGLLATVLSHLAFTELMMGRESAAAEVATTAIGFVGSSSHVPSSGSARDRAALALTLSGGEPRPESVTDGTTASSISIPDLDLCTRLWLRVHDSRAARLTGSVADAERILATRTALPVPEEKLPTHLQVVVGVERALVAALASDRTGLQRLEARLVALGATGEAALVRGLLADLDADRDAAAAAFAAASRHAGHAQPPTRATALVCHAQILDAQGAHDAALVCLREATRATEVRRSTMPFHGWVRQGTPVVAVLERLSAMDGPAASPWVEELAAAAATRPDAVSELASVTATPRERSSAAELVLVPALTPRERDVLRELARGATYADIAETLFVSENTVKTHVCRAYGKLGVSRRSEALAVARSHHLL